MKRIMFSSFEKTLIDDEEAIDVKTIVEIDNFRKKGNKFAVISENILNYSFDYNRDFPFIDYIIALDGAVIYDVNKNEIIFKKSISASNLKKVLSLRTNVELYGINNVYSKDYYLDNCEKLKNDIYKVKLFFSNEDDKKYIFDKLNKINVNIFVNEKESCFEIVSGNVSRVHAINKLVIGKNYDDVWVVLGIEKDIEIIDNYKSYIVNDAPQTLKDSSGYGLENENTFGVLELLRKINT